MWFKNITNELRIRTQDVQNKHEKISLLCSNMQTWIWKKHDKVMVQDCA